MSRHIINTGQQNCFDETGKRISCTGSGQDSEFHPGVPWPAPRFSVLGDNLVHDHLTGLIWSRDANPGEFPCTWPEALHAVDLLNDDQYCGHQDWRLPNRRELRSLMDYRTRKPSLPNDHPFVHVFIHWYWSSTTAVLHPGYAWYLHLEGARMFYGKKNQEALFWPVRGTGNGQLAATGQKLCYAADGKIIPCAQSGQDGELQCGASWPTPRFSIIKDTLVQDHLTGLIWQRKANVDAGKICWQRALEAIQKLNAAQHGKWRLPTINELESLVDAACHSPALSKKHPFVDIQEGYWSSTTSSFETDWAWVLYMEKGACGVGYKPDSTFYVWPVTESTQREDEQLL